jgi:Oxygen-sensitive ribonucleoside-triphosphate reductase
MLASIIKRDGTEVPFDSVKILNAITKANQAVGGEDMSPTDLLFVTEKVCKKLESRSLKHVEEIQDVVEETLIQYDYAKSAKAYILYRAEHTKIRNAESYLMDIYKKLTYSPALQEDIKRENANIDGDTAMGTMLKYGSEGSKFFIDNYILPKDASAAHLNGDIHIHDKDFYMLTETCCQIDLIPLFKNGFSTGHGHLREPNSIESYSALACIAIQANQNEMHGGQSVPHFDFAMAEGVIKTYRKGI